MKPSRALRSAVALSCALGVAACWALPGAAGAAARALGWVGSLYPPGGSSNAISAGAGFTVYVQVYEAGVTEPAGPGADISCTLYWSEVTAFGGPWLAPVSTPMSYNVDIGNNDEYMASIAPTEGRYEYTAYCTDLDDGAQYWQGAGNGRLTVTAGGVVTLARALWMDAQTIAWSTPHGPAGVSYELHHAPTGGLTIPVAAGAGLPLAFDHHVALGEYAKFPNAAGHKALKLAAADVALVPELLRGEIAVAVYDAGGQFLEATGLQIQGVLDDLYAYEGPLGLVWESGVPVFRVWAPTARSVEILRYEFSLPQIGGTPHAMSYDGASGVWSYVADASWAGRFYKFEVEVFVPETGQVEHNLVTDPYALDLTENHDRAAVVDLADPALAPPGWDELVKPPLAAPEDISVYELHVRDFSIFDATVDPADRGRYRAFTYDGTGRPLSQGMAHLLGLAQAGLTHVHLLPVFDMASVDENGAQRTEPDPAVLASFPPDSDQQQAFVGASRGDDGFNWGYDPVHYGTPEGSYASSANGGARVRELRELVQALNDNGLRVVLDVAYNHTSSRGQFQNSVLDRIVPGYYHRLNADGFVETASCCNDTASEFRMMERLMIDTLVRWARDYKIDGFRFDLMSFHTLDNMNAVRSALQALTPAADGVDGSGIYLYGEGWDTGSAKAKGFVHASQWHLAGSGIGTFNDRFRDAAHGGFSADLLEMRTQGFANGQSYDWNGHYYPKRFQSDLRLSADRLRIGLAGNLQDYEIVDQNGNVIAGRDLAGTGYTLDPQEAIQYVTKHDNETLYDLGVYKAPWGESGTPRTPMAERVRIQKLALALVGLAQGVPFFHAGADLLRSKSMDSNSYDSGDWFNRLDFGYAHNNYGVGLPPAWTSEGRWSTLAPLLADPALRPAPADIAAARDHLKEVLAIRRSSKLFRLETAGDVIARLHFHNTGPAQQDGLIVMTLRDDLGADLDPVHEYLVVLFNANKFARSFTLPEAAGLPLALHPVQAASSDPVVRTAHFEIATGTFDVPARTAAVFVSGIAPGGGPVTIGWVGGMYPAGSSASALAAGDPGGLTVYVQVWAAGVTEAPGRGAGIRCFLHWGRAGEPWSDLEMAYNVDIGNNDEYSVTLPAAGLAPGTYGYTAWCSGDGGETQVWRGPDDGGDGLLTVTPVPVAPPGNAFVHLFEWRWSDVAQECAFLAAKGYTAVQVSPPMEHRDPASVAGGPWWLRYQPMSYRLESRSGTRAEFESMVSACAAHGVGVYVDVPLNHMTHAQTGTWGTDGTVYLAGSYDYPPTHGPGDFHYCGTDPGGPLEHDLLDFGDRDQVQRCELDGLADLDTGAPAVRETLRAFLQDLLDAGVAGFRVDAAKHVAAADLEVIFAALDGQPYVYHEIADTPGEPVRPFEYLPGGDVTELETAYAVGRAFLDAPDEGCPGANLAALAGFGFGIAHTDDAVVFTDNHDIQRDPGPAGACVVDHRDGAVYDLANAFVLAHPYGYPMVMSSYHWDGAYSSQGPPAGPDGTTTPVYAGGEPTGCNATEWVCEHRRTPIAGMVGLRRAAGRAALTHWWSNGANQIAFGREDRAFVVINRESVPLVASFQTGLAPGAYCDVIRYEQVGAECYLPGTTTPAPPEDLIVVGAGGEIASLAVPALGAAALHVAALDTDGDGAADASDNCTLVANADQRDTNGDGYGNACDPDLDDSGAVNFVDLGLLRAAFFGPDPDADFNGDGAVNFLDLGTMKAMFFGPPGPSGLAP